MLLLLLVMPRQQGPAPAAPRLDELEERGAS